VILIPTLRYILYKLDYKKPLLIDPISTEEQDRIIEVVEILCDWEVWSTDDDDVLKAFRSNTVKNVSEALPELKDKTLITQLVST